MPDWVTVACLSVCVSVPGTPIVPELVCVCGYMVGVGGLDSLRERYPPGLKNCSRAESQELDQDARL